jgi:hypothetical protein
MDVTQNENTKKIYKLINLIMKNFRNTALLILLSAGGIFAQNITVQGEKKLNTDFKKYKTFTWMKDNAKTNQVIEYTYAEMVDPTLSKASKKAEKKEEKREEKNMTKGDKKMLKNDIKMGNRDKNGELVIYSYSFILPSEDSVINNAAINSVEDELEGRGYHKNDANPDLLVAYKIFDSRTQIKGFNAPPTELNGVMTDEVRQPKDTVTYALKPGTVFISLIDAKTGKMVWEGFASGVAQSNDMINDKVRVKEAINLIFKKFEFRADKYSMNN